MNKHSIIALVLVLAGCSSLAPTQLPVERPSDFTVEIYESGGMLDQSTNWSISGSEASYLYRYNQLESSETFTVTPAQLDAIWGQLRAVRFDRIAENEEQDVYDRGGTTITVTYGDETIIKSDSGSTFISSSNGERFYTVSRMIIQIFDEYLQTREQTVAVDISAELLPDMQWLYLNGNKVYEVKTQTQLPQTFTLLPGEYQLSHSILVDGEPAYDTTTFVVPTAASTATLVGSAETPTVVVQTQ